MHEEASEPGTQCLRSPLASMVLSVEWTLSRDTSPIRPTGYIGKVNTLRSSTHGGEKHCIGGRSDLSRVRQNLPERKPSLPSGGLLQALPL